VVPYYQQRAGILSQAVGSALRQRGIDALCVIVVDDGSPVPARTDIAQLQCGPSQEIRVIEQANAGPGAARNRALNAVPAGTRYVAFLDSDDLWSNDHLKNAITGLELGFDFYFSDFFFSDYKERSAFDRAGRIPLEEHRLLDPGIPLYEYTGDMVDQIVRRGNVIGTPTVVCRYERIRNLSFRQEFFNGQDYLFWLDAARAGLRFVFSAAKECHCGTGVNIYAGTGWGSERSLFRLANELQVWKFVGGEFDLAPAQVDANIARIGRIRDEIVRDILHRVLRRKQVDWGVVAKILKLDRRMPFFFVSRSLQIAITRVLPGRPRSTEGGRRT
jgi:succinoglycan biosynthesis protein ExoW